MAKTFPVWMLVALIFIIAVGNAIADYWHLYFYLRWLDIPMHIMGGLWVSLFALVGYYTFFAGKPKDRSSFFVIAFAIAAGLTIGLGWEIFEFEVDKHIAASGIDLGDTLKDLVDDFIGACIGAAIFLKRGYNVLI